MCARREDGSITMAMIGIIVVGTLSVALFTLALQAQRNVRTDRDYNTAVFGADAAVQQALTYISQQPESVTSLSSSLVGLTQEELTVGGVTSEWSAEKINHTTWEIRAAGTNGERTRTIEAVAERRGDHFLAAFADVALHMRGDNGVTSYNRATGGTDTGNGAIGSNGAIEMEGSSHADQIMLFGGAATCTGAGCDTGRLAGFRDRIDLNVLGEQLEVEMDAACSTYTALSTSTTTLVGGETYCVSDLTFDVDTVLQDATPENPVTIYVTGTVDSANHVDINCETCASDPDSATPDSTLLRIRSIGPHVRLGNHTTIASALLAPRASCTGSPSNAQGEIFGSMICNDLGNQGGWSYHYDDALVELDAEHYDIVEWREEVGGTTSHG